MTVPDANDSDAVRAWAVSHVRAEPTGVAGLILALLARAEAAEAERDALREMVVDALEGDEAGLTPLPSYWKRRAASLGLATERPR